MKLSFTIFCCSILLLSAAKAQGPYAPAAGQSNSTAIHMDSSLIVDWASVCNVQRGWVDIADTNLGKVSAGEPYFATGKSNLHGIVSLGDGGEAIVRFNGLLFDGQGPDFAVFENAFSDTFLELAFVEVSSDGQNFFRFPSQSRSDTAQQIDGFGAVDPTMINNLAGKYRSGFGTPFDLAELANTPGLDIQKISHIRIIDVVGSIDSAYLNRDSQGRPINDPYPTPYPTGGFDLDGVGAIHISSVGLTEDQIENRIRIYPNPIRDQAIIDTDGLIFDQYQLLDYQGRLIQNENYENSIDLRSLDKGSYILRLIGDQHNVNKRIIKL